MKKAKSTLKEESLKHVTLNILADTHMGEPQKPTAWLDKPVVFFGDTVKDVGGSMPSTS